MERAYRKFTDDFPNASRHDNCTLAHDLDGQVAIAFPATGVVCTVDAPVA
jgi:hypothetical protein